MPLGDLDVILNKDAIIATYPAQSLRSSPHVVEEVYRTHARTHISLGDTSKYVETLFKWIGGGNKGAFIGAVVGEHGHGKTSFQIHVWAQSVDRGILAVPPFSWDKITDLVDGVAAWVQYALGSLHPELAGEAERLYQDFKEKTLEEVATQTAARSGRGIDEVLASLRDLSRFGGATLDTSISPERVLDYYEQLARIVERAGFTGLLVLLDEPEIAARRLNNAVVFQILFDLANGLLQRQGEFGIFLSLPERFLAQALRTFPALPARLQARSCLPRLRNMYGPDFAQVLWSRFVSEFDLGEEGQIISDQALRAIGQVASSDRADLSYGPRTVVSAFRQLIRHHQMTGRVYGPDNFVADCLSDEVLVSPDYITRIRQAITQGETVGLDGHVAKVLAAFPNGILVSELPALELDAVSLEGARRNHVVYKRGNIIGFTGLQLQAHDAPESDELWDSIEEVFSEFAPKPETFLGAKKAVVTHLLPWIFERRQGQQFLGWDGPRTWREINGVLIGDMEGAFRETEEAYPARPIIVALGPLNFTLPNDHLKRDKSDVEPDFVIEFHMRWSREVSLPDQLIEISPGNPRVQEPGRIKLVLDLAGDPLDSAAARRLEEYVDHDLLTPLGILNLMHELGRRTFSKDYQAAWDALRAPLVRELVARFLVDSPLRSQVEALVLGQIAGGGTGVIGAAAHWVLRQRYPDYSTLLRQPRWEEKVDAYIRVLKNQDIPAAAKRGHEPWIAPTATVARAFGTNPMNLSDSFSGYSTLVVLKKAGREETEVSFRTHPLEQRLQGIIMAAKPDKRIKPDGREVTWWIELHEVMEELLYSGYNEQEISKIADIGVSRGSFFTSRERQKYVLYCLPLDLDQMKVQLRGKLSDLRQETTDLQRLPNHQTTFDFAGVIAEIEAITGQADFDKLSSRINKEFEQNHNRLPGYLDRLAGELKQRNSEVQRVKGLVTESRQVVALQTLPAGTSNWAADLGQYIVANLKATAQDIRRECTDYATEAERRQADITSVRPAPPPAKIAALVKGWEANAEIKAKVQSLEDKQKQLSRHLDEYDEWRKLLTQSDSAYADLLELKKEVQHATRAAELLSQLESIWDQVSRHLKTRNVTGLGSHKQFSELIDHLDQSRKTYVRELAVLFNKKKEVLNIVLVKVGAVGGARVTEGYNPLDPLGSEERLLGQALEGLRGTLSSEIQELSAQVQEIVYARDVLGSLTAEEAQLWVSELGTALEELQQQQDQIKKDWLSRIEAVGLGAGQDEPIEVSTIQQVLTRTRDALKGARLAVRSSQITGELGDAAAELLDLVPPDRGANLKELVLAMMSKGRDSGEVLSTALNSLSELFRSGKVQIKVELPRR